MPRIFPFFSISSIPTGSHTPDPPSTPSIRPSVIYRSFNSFILKKNHVFISPRLIRARSG
jgi:hypothetical protein